MDFNDPFEFTPRMNHDFNFDLLSEENIAAAAAVSGPPPANLGHLRASIRDNPEKIQTAFAPVFAETCRKTIREFCRRVTDGFGVICFSYSRRSILMWSHYAAKHTG